MNSERATMGIKHATMKIKIKINLDLKIQKSKINYVAINIEILIEINKHKNKPSGRAHLSKILWRAHLPHTFGRAPFISGQSGHEAPASSKTGLWAL